MIMKKLAIKCKVTLTLFAVLFGVNLMGQAPTLSLQNTSEPYNATTNPYVINDAEDWGKLATDVAGGYSYAGEVIKLTANITVSTMVGTSTNKFSGHFNGATGVGYGLYTLTFNYGTSVSPTTDEIVAPFRYTNGATIEYLMLAGDIYTNAGKEAGLIGVNTRTSTNTTVNRVINTLNFHCDNDLWDAEGGGFAYDGKGVTFTDCSYQGVISAYNYHGGFCGNADSNTSFTNCLFNPDADNGVYWAENFVYNKEGNTPSNYYETCYYTLGNNQEDSTQGTLVYVGSLPAETIGNKITTLYGTAIYKPVTVVIGNVSNIYNYTGSTIEINPTVYFDGTNALTPTVYCTTTISPSTVQEIGTYTLTVTGVDKGDNRHYDGSITKTFKVIDESSTADWVALQALIDGSDETITLDKDYTAGASDVALLINRDVTIDLKGYTIDRNLSEGIKEGYVIKINSGKTVTIKNGTITGGWNKASSNSEYSDNDGGGINNMGALTLEKVIITGNKCEKNNGGIYRTARGGGVYTGKNSTLSIKGCDIYENESQGGGGGIFAYQATSFTIAKSDDNDITKIHSNKSLDKGGGIRVDAGSTATITDCHIYSNEVEYHNAQSASNGGGIHLDAGTLDITHSTINNNTASKYGGGIYMMGGRINATNCSIQYNMSYDTENWFTGYGGGVCIMGGKFYMNGGSVIMNYSYMEKGGGIFVNTGTTLSLSGSVNISGNIRYDEELKDFATNVYLVNSSSKITIGGSIAGSTIGVDKNGKGVFTSGLSGNGTVANFTSDDTNYQVLPYSGEAKQGVPETAAPPVSGTWEINSAQVLTTAVSGDVTSITFGTDGCLYVNEGGLITSATSITNSDVNKLIINGGQIVTTSGTVNATYKKSISSGWTWGENWYLISSPFNNISITDNTNLVSKDGNNNSTYDLYRFNESVVLQWENYRNDAHTDFTTLANGRGYMYRNKDDYTITMTGVLQTSEVNYSLTCTDQVNSVDNKLKGFNLLGNPYSHNIYKNDVYASSGDVPAINNANLSVGYYKLKRETYKADVFEATIGYNNPILPGEGFLVQTSSAFDLTITNTTNEAASYSLSKGQRGSGLDNIMFEVSNNNYHDVTYAMFSNGRGLNKIGHLDAEAPMIYIKKDSEKYAIATMDGNAKSINLSFEAMTTGIYTLKIKPQGDFNYIHVFDKLTGRDIDMLADGEYSFIGAPNDQDDRFIVRLCETVTDSNGNAIFAYQNGNDIIVDGNGELQVFDITGRLITTLHINGVHGICTSSLQAGVYILRLNEMSQKIVVR